jgi:hypothetical protein
MEQLQRYIYDYITASSYMAKYLGIYSYIAKPFLIYDFATAPLCLYQCSLVLYIVPPYQKTWNMYSEKFTPTKRTIFVCIFVQPFGLDFCVLYSILLHLSPLRFLRRSNDSARYLLQFFTECFTLPRCCLPLWMGCDKNRFSLPKEWTLSVGSGKKQPAGLHKLFNSRWKSITGGF